MAPPQPDLSDITLIERTRLGDSDAYGVLHDRHAGSATALARRMSRNPADADDLVSEGFTRVLSALQAGKGPDTAFRPYLLSTIRRLAYDRTTREQREAPTDETEESAVATAGDPVVDGFERDAAAAAFSSLPERWRLVLWHTEVEGQSPAEVGTLLGMSANAVAALSYRAREGLREAYLTEHSPITSGAARDCRKVTSRLSGYVRGNLTPTREAHVREHLESCDDCQAAYLELANVNTSMPALVAAAVLGGSGTVYLAEIGTVTKVIAAAGGAAKLVSTGGSAGISTLSSKSAATATGWSLPATAGSAAAAVALVVGVAAFTTTGSNNAAARPEITATGSQPPSTDSPSTKPTGAADPDPQAPTNPSSTLTERVQGPVAPRSAAVGTRRPGLPPRDPAPTATPTSAPGRSTPTSATPSTSTTTVATTTSTSAATSTTATSTSTTSSTTTTTVPAPAEDYSVRLRWSGIATTGNLQATLINNGPRTGQNVRIDISVSGSTVTLQSGSSADEFGSWQCSQSSQTLITCSGPGLDEGDDAVVSLPLAVVPSGAQTTYTATVFVPASSTTSLVTAVLSVTNPLTGTP